MLLQTAAIKTEKAIEHQQNLKPWHRIGGPKRAA
jgi:hypothetical protein